MSMSMSLSKNLLIGLFVVGSFGAVGCKDKSAAPTTTPSGAAAVTEDDDGDEAGEPGGGRHEGRRHFGGGFCKKATDEQWAALQKCGDKLPAELKTAQDACNTQVYGAAAPTKEQACDREKRRAHFKCMREKNVKMDREARKDFFQCSMGVMKGAEPEAPTTK